MNRAAATTNKNDPSTRAPPMAPGNSQQAAPAIAKPAAEILVTILHHLAFTPRLGGRAAIRFEPQCRHDAGVHQRLRLGAIGTPVLMSDAGVIGADSGERTTN